MKVLLLNVDAPFNLAIRKMYKYYSELGGCCVDMVDIGFKGYPHSKHIIFNAKGFDRVCVSNIFEINKDRVRVINCDDVQYGGVGSRNPMAVLPAEIEELEPYYFDDEDTSYGFLTRGCIRNCYFCKVPKTEGALRPYRTVEQVVKHRKVKFMDNNILAYSGHKEILKRLADMQVKVDFNQGLDFRLLDEENSELLSKLNYWGEYVFAFDDWKYRNMLEPKMELFRRYVPTDWKIKVFVYIHPNMHISDTVRRINWCKEQKILPYIMRDVSCWDSKYKDFYTDIAAYCNQPAFFKKMDFETFLRKRHTNIERIENSLKKWRDCYE